MPHKQKKFNLSTRTKGSLLIKMSEKKDEEPKSLFAGFGGTSAETGTLFGNTGPVNFSFTPAAFGKKDDDEEEGGEEDGNDEGPVGGADESHVADLKPLVHLQQVEVHTGEENEEVVLKLRAKLYIFVKEDVYGGEVRKDWWRERGLGDVKILKDQQTGKYRLIMRQEKTLKLCANHVVSPETELTPTTGSNDRSWNFYAVDFANADSKPELFAIKFGSPENASKFREVYEEAKVANAKFFGESSASTVTSSKPSQKETSPSEKPQLVATIPMPSAAAPVTVESVSKDVTNLSVSQSSQPSHVTQPSHPIVGGYAKFDPNSPEAQQAAKFAAEKIGMGTLVKIASIKTQVVAGRNYRMALHIRYKNGEVHAHVVTVHEPLPHTKQPMSVMEAIHTGIVN